MIIELDRVDAEPDSQEFEVLLEAGRGGQRHLAAKHRGHSAERATEAAAEGSLIARRALTKIGSGQVLRGVFQALVRQSPREARG